VGASSFNRQGSPRRLWAGRVGWCPLRRHRGRLTRGGRGGTGGRRRRWDPGKNFLVGGLQPSHFTPKLFLSGSELPNGLPQLVEALRHLLHLLRVDGSGWRRRDRLWGGLRSRCRLLGFLHRLSSSIFQEPASDFVQLAIVCLTSGDQPSSGARVAITCLASPP
jgi:hypothetical protein